MITKEWHAMSTSIILIFCLLRFFFWNDINGWFHLLWFILLLLVVFGLTDVGSVGQFGLAYGVVNELGGLSIVSGRASSRSIASLGVQKSRSFI